MMIEHHRSNYSTKQYVTKQQYLVYKEKIKIAFTTHRYAL